MARIVRLLAVTVVSAIVAWRAIVSGFDAIQDNRGIFAHDDTADTSGGNDVGELRRRLARNPADSESLLRLAEQFQRLGDRPGALAALKQALDNSPTKKRVLAVARIMYFTYGDDASGLMVTRRLMDLYPDTAPRVFPVFAAALEMSPYRAFFEEMVRDDPKWFPSFFQHVCNSASVNALQVVFAPRIASTHATPEEQRCFLDRLQREGRWALAYQFWLNGLPAEHRQRVGFIFNGGFELPISNVGFDWRIPGQDGVTVTSEPAEGAGGRRALHVMFTNKRFSAPPVYEHLQLTPGRYRFSGRGRAQALNSWLGLQWGLYCLSSKGEDQRQLAHSDPLLGTSDWQEFQSDFTVTRDCSVQIVRLELANPVREAKTGGSAPVRLRGNLWFDDLRVKLLD